MAKIHSKYIAASGTGKLTLVPATASASSTTVGSAEAQDWQVLDSKKDAAISREDMDKFLHDMWTKNVSK